MDGPAERISVVVVDDHPLMRERTAQVVAGDDRLSLVGEAADGEEALEKIRSARPVVVVLDIFMPGMNGAEVLRTLRDEMEEIKALVLTAGPRADLFDILQLRPDSLLYKDSDFQEICDEIVAVWRGEKYSPGRAVLAHALMVAGARPPLTEREIALLEHLADGRQVQESAMRLGVSRRAAEEYLRRIRDKLNVATNSAAVARAYEVGHLRSRSWS